MNDFGLEHSGTIGGDRFNLIKARRSSIKLDYYLNKFNENDYWIYKYSRKQKLVGSEWKNFKYSGYIFFRKDVYKKEYINECIEFISQFGGLMYLTKPFPPIEIMQKIKVII